MSNDQSPEDEIRAALARMAELAGDGARVRHALAGRPRQHQQRRALLLVTGAVAVGAIAGPGALFASGGRHGASAPTASPAPPSLPPPPRAIPLRWQPTWLPDGYVEVSRMATVDDPGGGFQQRIWELPGGSPDDLLRRLYLQAGPRDWFAQGSWRESATQHWLPFPLPDRPREVAQVVWQPGPAETVAVAALNLGPDGLRIAERVAASVVADGASVLETPMGFGWLPAGVSGHQLARVDGYGSGPLTSWLRVESATPATPPVVAALGSWTARFRCDEEMTARGQLACGWVDYPPDLDIPVEGLSVAASTGLHLALGDERELYLSLRPSNGLGAPAPDLADLVRLADSMRIGSPPDGSWAGRR